MITSNYRAQMDENRKAVDENQLKLQKLMELEQELTQNIQRNIEKKYDLMRSQASTASALQMMATTNHSSVKARSKINNLMSNSDNTIAYAGVSDSKQASK